MSEGEKQPVYLQYPATLTVQKAVRKNKRKNKTINSIYKLLI